MSTITKVTFPVQIKFGQAFDVTVQYQADATATRVDVTSLSHNALGPEAIPIDPAKTSVSTKLTISALPAAGPQVILVRFTLGASDWTSGAMAS